jgi:hypothetical protein
MDEPRHPVGPEIDDSGNPTAVSPEDYDSSSAAAEEGAVPPSAGGQSEWDAGTGPGTTAGAASGEQREGARRPASGREMLAQLQQMIDTLAVQATPVMRDVAAKAAELAAIAGQKAGPLAHRAADATERVGERVAERSKGVAADLRAAQAREAAQSTATPADSPGQSATEGDALSANDETGG